MAENILSLCLAAYLIGYLIQVKANAGVGALIRLIAAAVYVLAVVLNLLGVAIG
jgi:hypothetical protein